MSPNMQLLQYDNLPQERKLQENHREFRKEFYDHKLCSC